MRSEHTGFTVRSLSAATIAIIVWSVTGYDAISDPDCLDPDSHYPAVIEPTRVRTREGASLNITCSVEGRCRSRYNASDLYILKTVPEFYKNSSRVRLISSSAIQLHLAVIQEETDRGIWMCLVRGLPGRGLIQYTSHVQFVKDPLVPEIVSCVVDNWETLTCQWSPSYYQQLTHTMDKTFVYKFIYSTRSMSARYCCSDSSTSSCQHELMDNFCMLRQGSTSRSFQMGAVYNLTVRAETGDAFKIGQWLNFNTSLNVRPGAPEQVTMTSYNRSHYAIVWLPPGSAWEEAKEWTFNYSVAVSTEYEMQSIYTTDTQYLLPVYPYTRYRVKIRLRPIQGGFWSEEFSTEVLTEIREPEVNPMVFASGYEATGMPCGDNCDVRIYWQPLDEWQLGGPGFSYKILTREVSDDEHGKPGNWSIVKSIGDYKQNTESISIRAWKTSQVTIVASNVLGDASTPGGVMWIPPRNLAVNISERLILECAGNNLTAWLEGATSTAISSALYVLFWQNKETKDYRSVGWMPLVKYGSMTYRLRVQLSDPCQQYEYSLSKTVTVSGQIRTSGLVKYKDCIYAHGAEHVTPPADVQITDRSRNSLSISWRQPHCDVTTAYIGAYHVYYCEKDERFNNCKDPLFRVEMRVSRDVTRLVLGDLQADRVYLVYVSSHVYRGDIESVRVLASGPSHTLPGLSVGVIVGLLFTSVMAVVVTGVIIRLYWRGCVRLKSWYTKSIIITMPQESCNQEDHQPYSSSARNVFRSEHKQNGLYTRSNFLLKSSSDSGRFSAVVSEIYGMDIRRDSPTRCHNARMYHNECLSSCDRVRSPLSSDPVTCVSTNPDITRYARASYSPEHLLSLNEAATPEDPTNETVDSDGSDQSTATGEPVNNSEPEINVKMEDFKESVTEISADLLPIGRTDNYVTEGDLFRLNQSSDVSGYVPCCNGVGSRSGYIAYQDVANTVGGSVNTSQSPDGREVQDTWAYVSHDFVNS